MRKAPLISLVLVAALGGGVAWIGLPIIRREAALSAIASVDAARRDGAWTWLSEHDDLDERLSRINAELADAGDRALRDAAAWLHQAGMWGWDRQPNGLLLRALLAQARGEETEKWAALDLLAACPARAASQHVGDAMMILTRLLEDDDAAIRHAALDAAVAWIGFGMNTHELLCNLRVPDHDAGLRRRYLLLLAATLDEVRAVHEQFGRPLECRALAEVTLVRDADIDEAALLAQLMVRPDDDRPIVEAMDNWSGDPEPAFAAILRWSHDPMTDERLARLERAGDAVATFALQARSPQRDRQAAERVALDGSQPRWRRRLAAWRWPGIPVDIVADILQEDPVGADGTVSAAVLLAAAALPRDLAAEQAESWIRSLDDDRKRAGALLAGLTGAHEPLLREAFAAEDIPEVRAAFRLGLIAVRPGEAPPIELEWARLVMTSGDGDFNADAALCLLATGDPAPLPHLTSPPREPWRLSAQHRAWMIERFVPPWHEFTGRPLGGDLRSLRLHFELLDAKRVVTQRLLWFDNSRRAFVEQ